LSSIETNNAPRIILFLAKKQELTHILAVYFYAIPRPQLTHLEDQFDMKRRQFLALSTLALATSPVLAGGSSQVEFTKEAYQKALASGEPFMLDFAATW